MKDDDRPEERQDYRRPEPERLSFGLEVAVDADPAGDEDPDFEVGVKNCSHESSTRSVAPRERAMSRALVRVDASL
jgi:hypothetical protein